MLVSIVITNYNKGKFLPFLFKTLELTMQPEVEVIIIDDCSTQSFDLQLLKNCPFKVFYNTENKGLGYVRNQALDLCQGKYIAFIDGDDFIATDYVASLVDMAKLGYDVINFPFLEYSLEANTGYGLDIYQCVWSSLYSLDFIKKYKIHFKPLRIREDLDFNKELLGYSPKMYYYEHSPLYFYNLYAGGNMSNGSDLS